MTALNPHELAAHQGGFEPLNFQPSIWEQPAFGVEPAYHEPPSLAEMLWKVGVVADT